MVPGKDQEDSLGRTESKNLNSAEKALVKISCPHCEINGSVDERYVGRQIKCPACRESFHFAIELLQRDLGDIQCPLCGVKGYVDKALSGKNVRCPECRELFPCPSADNETDGGPETEDSKALDAHIGSEDNSEPISPVQEKAAGSGRDDESAKEPASGLSGDAVEEEYPEKSGQDDEAILAAVDGFATETISETTETEGGQAGYHLEDTENDKDEGDSSGLTEILQDEGLPDEGDGSRPTASFPDAGDDAAGSSGLQTGEKSDQGPPPLSADQRSKKTGYYIDDLSLTGLLKRGWEIAMPVKGQVMAGAIVTLVLCYAFSVAADHFLMPRIEEISESALVWYSYIKTVALVFIGFMAVSGLMYFGVERSRHNFVSWKMVFSGLPRVFSLFVAFCLMGALIAFGLVLFVIPGVYLLVGYSMTMSLIIDKKFGPIAAMRMSRKTIDKIWWKAFGILFITLLFIIVGAIPVGIGLAWALPLNVVVMGILYNYLFRRQGM